MSDAIGRYRLLYWVAILYLAATLLLYFFGPIPWIVISPSTLIVIGLCYVALAIGAHPSDRLKPRTFGFSVGSSRASIGKLAPSFIIPILMAATLMLAARNWILFDTPVPGPSFMFKAYDQLKSLERLRPSLLYSNFLLSSALLWAISSVFINESRNPVIKVTKILVIVFYAYSALMTGSGSAVIELTLLVGIVYARKAFIDSVLLLKIFLSVIVVGGVVSGLLWARVGNLESMTIPIVPRENTAFKFDLKNSTPPAFAAFIVSMYLTNGYQGLQFSATKEPAAQFTPFVSSLFVQRQYERLGVLPADFKRLELQIDEEDGWKAGLLWSTAFLWFSEEFPLILLPILCFFIGRMFFHVACGYLLLPTGFRLAQTMLMTRVVLFLPLNAIFLATGEELVRTLVFIIVPALVIFALGLRDALAPSSVAEV